MTVTRLLQLAGDLPALESRLLLAFTLSRPRAWLAAHPEASVTPLQERAFQALCARRLAGEPIAYLVGEREFYGLRLMASEAALIPRPETELLVDLALGPLPPKSAARVLDLGTGTGAIALAIAHQRPAATVTASDRSVAALALARANAARLQLDRVRLVQSDWYVALPPERWELIVANPPYIAGDDAHLTQGDLRFEPRAALTPEGDGLDALRIIIAGAPLRLAPRGWLMVEHGWDQGEVVRALFAAAGFSAITTARDLGDQERVTQGQLRA